MEEAEARKRKQEEIPGNKGDISEMLRKINLLKKKGQGNSDDGESNEGLGNKNSKIDLKLLSLSN